MKDKKIKKKILNDDRCIFCGKILPEGYGHVCKECEKNIMHVVKAK